MYSKLIIFVLLILYCAIAEGRIFSSRRIKRQTVVSSSANSNGTASNVINSAAANNYKTIDGNIGVNVSAAGNASGANFANLTGQGSGSAGSQVIKAGGDVSSLGTNAQSVQNMNAAIYGSNMSANNFLQGTGQGVGATSAKANGSAIMVNGSQSSPMSSNNSQAMSSASGSQASNSQVVLNQILSWNTIMTQLFGSAVGNGYGNAYSSSNIGSGNAVNGVEGNSVVSAMNTGNGSINTQVNVNGTVNNTRNQLQANGYGTAGGSGNTSLVQASNLQSNSSGVNKTISNFGDGKIYSDGTSGVVVNSSSNLDNQGATNGVVGMNVSSYSNTKNMTVQTGIQANEGSLGTLNIGTGGVEGVGNQKSNASSVVDTIYNGNGQGNVIVKSQGSSQSNNNSASALDVSASADVANTNGVANSGNADSAAIANGASSSINGTSFLNVNNNNTGGSSMIAANAWGPGSSNVLTNANLQLTNGTGAPRNATVQGSVGANGQNTNSYSISVATDQNGKQSISSYQNATSSGSGSSSASASNAGVLKRKKRSVKSRNVDRLGRILLTLL